MRKPEQSAEPSIEEILASIRRIIADDGAQPAARGSNPQPLQDAPVQPVPAAPRQSYADPYYAEPAEPAEYTPPRSEYTPPRANDDEILELTEDFMVEEEAAQSGAPQTDLSPAEQDLHASLADLTGLSRPRQPPSGQELESVISNVVAEVQRLSGGGAPAPRETPKTSADDWAPPPAPMQKPPRKPPSIASWPAPEAPVEAPRPKARDAAPPAPKAPPAPSAPHTTWPASPPAQIEAPFASPPQAEAPYAPTPPTAPSTPPRTAAKPVWSARHLSGEAPAPVARPRGAAAMPPSSEAPAHAETTSRESWDEGVQMPVPDSGPTAPFPEPPADDAELVAHPGSAAEGRPEIEKDKTFVGEMLTRVFGNTPKKSEEPKPAPAAGRVGPKAEELAKTTIAEFAKEKLRAPSVAEALHADKPFMDAITDSLEHAMAETQATQDAASQAQMAEMPEFEDEDELPEALLPPDSQSGSFEVAPSEAHGMPPVQFPPLRVERPAPREPAPDPDSLPDMPEPPRHHEALGEGLRRAHAEMARAEAAADVRPRAAAPKPFPTTVAAEPPLSAPTLFPTTVAAQSPVAVPPPLPPVSADLAPGLTMPPGIEDTIKELIKPLIVQWLNENLPRIVERAVREELSGQGPSGPFDGPRRR